MIELVQHLCCLCFCCHCHCEMLPAAEQLKSRRNQFKEVCVALLCSDGIVLYTLEFNTVLCYEKQNTGYAKV